MKKKIILFGAALAALATFTSCSSEDDLTVVEPQQPVIEKKLVPFSVGAEVNETRGSCKKLESLGWKPTISFEEGIIQILKEENL